MESTIIWKVAQIVLIVGFPALAALGARHLRFLEWMGPVVLCYLFGILLTNVFGFPDDQSVSTLFTEITVALAIPLLLFSTNFIKWLRLAKKTALSIALAFGSVLLCSTVAFFILADKVEESSKIAGMLVGVYTGGTPNMSAIGVALSVKEETFILINAVDVVLGGLYLILLMTAAKKLMGRFLPAFQKEGKPAETNQFPSSNEKIRLNQLILALGFSGAIVALSIGLAFLFSGRMHPTIVIMSITTLGIAFSFNKRIRRIQGTYNSGQYILLMFCVAIGTLANAKELLLASIYIFLFVAIVMFGSILLHYVLAIILKIDVDTFLITSTSAIYGPAFIGPIAGVLKNREIIVSGLTGGLMGYALGNYLGVTLSMLL
ncbi:MAG: DUF819 family protein [Candidatus Aminicenantaceae bacterium]